MAVTPQLTVARRPRSYVRVAGSDAADFLQRMLSNDVVGLSPGESCQALLLTPKARVIAPLRVLRRAGDDYLLLTEPELGETLRAHLLRARFAAKVEIADERHESVVVFGDVVGIPNADYGRPAVEILDEPLEPTLGDDELEALRIAAGTPRWGREIDDRVLPAEAGLVERAVDFAKGCYPGQEPIARLHHRGHANRRLRLFELEGSDLPRYDAEIAQGEKVVGRITSAARQGDRIIALGYLRTDVPPDAELRVGERIARLH